jgi:flagellar M-ring protein FliF
MDNTAVVTSTLQPAGTGWFTRLSPRGRALLLVGLAGVIAVVAATWLWSATPSWRILFTNLSDRDGGAIIAQLSQMNIPYKNADSGTLMVPADKVHEARLKLAAAGLPKGSLVGFEVMETQKFGVTQFQEQVNYQRALEGELARSIGSLAPVAGARVHLALPKQSGFLRDKQPPTASVLLQLHAGKALDRTQVAGIVHLVSSSVPELSAKNVSVVDQAGNLLSTQRDGAGTAGLDAAQLDYVTQIEANTIKRIEDILAPLFGPGNVRAQVTADVDFSLVEQMAETYKPNQSADAAAVRSQSTSDSSQPGPATPQGVPGALSNQPPTPPTAPINGQAAPLNANTPGAANAGASTRREAVTNFEVDKTVRHTKTPTGQIRRLTAAVVINHKGAVPGNAGTPLSKEELQDVNALVREAMGFSQTRGDSLNVVNSAFSQPEALAPQAVPLWQQPDVIAMGKEAGKALLFLLLTMIVVFGVVRPAMRTMAVPPKAQPLPESAAAPQLAAPAENLPPSPIEQVRALAKNDPGTVANVVKSWVGSEQPAGKVG